MLTKISMLITLILFLQVHAVPSDECNQETWTTNGPVYSILPAGDKVYIGGNFTQVGPYQSSGVTIDAVTGKPAGSFPKIDSWVRAACADGKGGWFICGNFSRINDIAWRNIAHILPDGSLDIAWNPNPDSTVIALAISGTKVYACGNFRNIGGKRRYGLAALDAITGNVFEWNPEWCFSRSVTAILVDGSSVYVGGDCGFAAVDSATGKILDWDPKVRGISCYIRSIIKSGTILFVGGVFDTVGGRIHRNLAAIDATTRKVQDWNIDVGGGGGVYSFAASGTTLFVGGFFSLVGGQQRNNLAALNATTGEVLPWSPDVDQEVWALASNGPILYVGGTFDTINAMVRSKIAALDAVTGNVLDWDPMIFGFNHAACVNTLVKSGETIFAAGEIYGIGGVFRKNLAAIDAKTGKALDWNPRADGIVYSLAVSGGVIYAGGEFDTVDGQSRNHIVAMDTMTGQVLPWNPDVNGWVYTIVANGSTVYAGGWFDTIAGQRRRNIAAIDAVTGTVLDWNPDADSLVKTLIVSGDLIYAGGNFASIDGVLRRGLAALDATTGNILDWNTHAGGAVTTLAKSGTTLYAGGNFLSIGGISSGSVAALNMTTGNAIDWHPYAEYFSYPIRNLYVTSVAECSTTLFVGGYFIGIGGQSCNIIAAMEPGNDSALDWNAYINTDSWGGIHVASIVATGTTIYIGGNFFKIDSGYNHPFFARFDTRDPAPVSRPAPLSDEVKNAGLHITCAYSPSAPSLRLVYTLQKAERVSLRIYNLSGRMQSELVNKHQNAGEHTVMWHGGSLPAGIYLSVLQAGKIISTGKVMVK